MSLADFDRFAADFRASGGGFAENLRFDVPPRFNFARDVFDPIAAGRDRIALWWIGAGGGERRLSFADVADESRRACRLMTDAGVERGDVVVVILPRIPEWWVINLACLRMGAVISPAPAQVRATDVDDRVRRSGATCVIAHAASAKTADQVVDACPELRHRVVIGGRREGWIDYDKGVAAATADFETVDTAADDTAAIYFTSGTEGPPKMVAHTHVSFPLRSRLTGVYWLDLHDGDLHWNLSDTGWAKAGWSSLYGPWNQGAAAFAVDSPRFDPRRVLELLARYPINTMCAAPTVYRAVLLEAGERIETAALRHCVAAGEPLGPEVIDGWKRATGITIRDGFGQTESSLLAVNFPGSPSRPGSMGKPVPGYTVAVLDPGGHPLAAGEEGDLAVRAAPDRPLGLFKEYVGDPAASAAARRGDWHLTGDRAYRDEDGYFWFVGRADDVIISSGYRIGPFEVESTLDAHPSVAECAVVASPDAVRGDVVKAFVVLHDGWVAGDELAAALQDHVKAATAPYKYPRRVEFVDALPKTATGKIRRAELRARERAAAGVE